MRAGARVTRGARRAQPRVETTPRVDGSAASAIDDAARSFDTEDAAHEVMETIERCASLARMIATALYHSSDSIDVDDARLGCWGIAALLDSGSHTAGELFRVLHERTTRVGGGGE